MGLFSGLDIKIPNYYIHIDEYDFTFLKIVHVKFLF